MKHPLIFFFFSFLPLQILRNGIFSILVTSLTFAPPTCVKEGNAAAKRTVGLEELFSNMRVAMPCAKSQGPGEEGPFLLISRRSKELVFRKWTKLTLNSV